MAEMIQTKQRMTIAEFKALPETLVPTELIEGELIVSPSPKNAHQAASSKLVLVVQLVMPGGMLFHAPMDLYLDDANAVQPDLFWVAPESRCTLGEDGYWYGPPELVVEIFSPSSTVRDKITKFKLYEKHGIAEYWMVDPVAEYIEVWQLVDGRYRLQGVFAGDDTFVSKVLGEMTIQVGKIFGN